MKSTFTSHLPSFILTILLSVCCLSVTAQNNALVNENKLLPPAEESFQKAKDLVSPWRSSGCHIIALYQEPNCHLVTAKEYVNSDTLTIYNQNGLVWYRFSLTFENPAYFLKNSKIDFLPFSTDRGFVSMGSEVGNGSVPPQAVILRLVGESPHWYKVEVSEETRDTKFVLKNDPLWSKTSWSYWLYESDTLYVDSKKSQLRDKSNGKIIEESAGLDFKKVTFLKADGDWANVEAKHNQKIYRGWIQWREGRNILVGCVFNDYKFLD